MTQMLIVHKFGNLKFLFSHGPNGSYRNFVCLLQAQPLPPEDASGLSVAIKESLHRCPIQRGTFLPWETSQTPRTPVLPPMVDGCVLAACRERVDD